MLKTPLKTCMDFPHFSWQLAKTEPLIQTQVNLSCILMPALATYRMVVILEVI